MGRLLQQGEMFLGFFGTALSVTLAIIVAFVEPARNSSAADITLTVGFGLLAMALTACAMEHAQHRGQLRWVWLMLTLSAFFWIVPNYLVTWVFHGGGDAMSMFEYMCVFGFGSAAIGVLRAMLPASLAEV